MQKLIAPLFFFFVLNSAFCFSQEKQAPVVINKQVEVVDYDYQYVLVELLSSIHYSLFYPVLTLKSVSENQLFFEQGRNIRPGFDLGFTQSVKFGRWAMSAGISFLRYAENFSYNEYLTRQVTIQDQDGSLQTVTVAVGEPVYYSRNNNLGYLKLPVAVGFFPNKFKNRLGINLQFNYHYLLSADYMTKYSNIQQAGNIPVEDFNSSFITVAASIAYSIVIYKNLSVTFEPFFNYKLNNLIDQKDLTFGMNQIGLKTGIALFY